MFHNQRVQASAAFAILSPRLVDLPPFFLSQNLPRLCRHAKRKKCSHFVHVQVVDRIVDVPFETVVYKDKIEFVDKVVYNDIRKEVPVDRRNTGTSEPQVQFSKNQRAMQRFGPGELPNRRTPRKVGLGLVLRHDEDKQVFVKEIVKGFAAERQGGLQAHDVIVAVDDSNLDGLDLEEIKHLTVGDEGSVVRLLLRRAGRELTVMLERIAGDPMRREPRESTPMSPHQPQLVAMGGRSNSSPQQME